MMRTPFIAGNWKMNLSTTEAIRLVREIQEKTLEIRDKQVCVAVCPAFVHLIPVSEYLKTSAQSGLSIALGAQNMYFEKSGAYTGEISGVMLTEIGCRYVIIGHSERRNWFKEDDATVAKKAKAAFQHGLLPIICVGETLEQRENKQTIDIVKSQVQKALEPLTDSQIQTSTIAYEPVWAIGTGRAATPEMAQEVHAMIRETLGHGYGKAVADIVRIQYGGSVTPENIRDLIAKSDIDGALVGGASLKSVSFSEIVKAAASAGPK